MTTATVVLGRARLASEMRAWAVIGVLAMTAFAAAWWLLGQLAVRGLYGMLVITDVPVYLEYGDRIASGLLPYRDWPLEYPPGAIPTFLVPSLLTPGQGDGGPYGAVFEALMLGCGVASVGLMAVALRGLGAGWVRLSLALGLAAASPLLVGPVLLSHFDLWPALLSVAAIAAVVTGHGRLGAAAVAVGAMTKVYPILILPFLLAYIWRQRGRRETLITAGVAAGVGLAILAPFALLGPGGIVDAVVRQASRPLQVESLGAATLLTFRVPLGLDLRVETSSGSQNLVGALPDALAMLSNLALAASLLGLLVWFVRRPPTGERFVQVSVAAIAAYVAFGKVLSPQYMAWLIPLVPLVGGRRGAAASLALAAALLLTAAYFPSRYFPMVQEFDTGAATLVFLRDLALVAVLAAVALPWWRIGLGARDLAGRLRVRAAALDIAGHPTQVLFLVLVGAFVLRAIWLAVPAGSLIFDETYYVNAARVILRIPVPDGAPYADATLGLDPNLEHPPLGKVAIALSMALFGDTALGWRLPSLVAGMVSLAAVYGIVRAAGETAWLGILAVLILALDNLTFVHGRIGTLDMLALAPTLVGAWLGLRGRPALAGVAFAVGVLVKITAIFGLAAFVLVELAMVVHRRSRGGGLPRGVRLGDFRPIGLAVASFAGVALIGLFLVDQSVSSFETPFDHVRHMLSYGAALQGGPSPGGIASNPWDWIVNNGRFDYLRVDVNVTAGERVVATYPSIRFQGALNPVLLGAAPLVVAFGAWLAIRQRSALAGWGIAWLAGNYLPFYLLVIASHRISYLYYFLPAVPAVAALSAVFLLRSGLPRPVTWVYLAATVVASIGLFPFRVLPG